MVWYLGRDMHRCRACGYLFAYRFSGQRYCLMQQCQAEKQRRARARESERRTTRSRVRERDDTSHREPRQSEVRAARRDADAALAELRAWLAAERNNNLQARQGRTNGLQPGPLTETSACHA